jgi:hypothetical protein
MNIPMMRCFSSPSPSQKQILLAGLILLSFATGSAVLLLATLLWNSDWVLEVLMMKVRVC